MVDGSIFIKIGLIGRSMKNLIVKDELSFNKVKSVLIGFEKGSFFSSRITEQQIINVWSRLIQDIISNQGLFINFLVEDINSIHSKYAIKDLESLFSSVNMSYEENCTYGFFQDLENLEILLKSTYDLNLTLVIGEGEIDFKTLKHCANLKSFVRKEPELTIQCFVLNFLFPNGKDVIITYNRNIAEYLDKTICRWTI